MITQGSRSTCPRRSPSSCRKTPSRPFIVSVNTEGEYVIKAGEADDEPGPERYPRGDAAYITEKAMGYLAINQNAPVVVADKSVRYEEVIPLMVALKKAGVPQVGLMTDPVN